MDKAREVVFRNTGINVGQEGYQAEREFRREAAKEDKCDKVNEKRRKLEAKVEEASAKFSEKVDEENRRFDEKRDKIVDKGREK